MRLQILTLFVLALTTLATAHPKAGPVIHDPAPLTTLFSTESVHQGDLAIPISGRGSRAAATMAALTAHATELGLPALNQPGVTLAGFAEATTPGGVHIAFRQSLNGTPIWRSTLHAHLNPAGDRIVSLAATLHSAANHPGSGDSWLLSADDARAIAAWRVGGSGRTDRRPRAEQMWVPGGGDHPSRPGEQISVESLRPAWMVHHSSTDPLGDWEVVVDAVTGEVLHLENRLAFVHGEGNVFLPDPVSSAGTIYGSPGYVDNNDGDTFHLINQQQRVTLHNITQDGAVFRLEGPYVRIVDFEAPFISPPEVSEPDGFVANRSEHQFEAASAYYHLDRMQVYIQTLGYDNLQNGPIDVDVHAAGGQDLSYYSPEFNRLAFGTGGVDDAEDADVLIHEYGHALHHAAVGGDVWGHDVLSIAEGVCDYLAASRSMEWSDHLPTRVFQWDGHNVFWPGRMVTTPALYPDQWGDDIYQNGTIFAHALWLLRSDLDPASVDLLVLEFLHHLTPGLAANQAAQALVTAAQSLLGDDEVAAVSNALLTKGFTLDPGSIEGTLRDRVSDEPLPNATVMLVHGNGQQDATTDDAGAFSFLEVPAGEATLSHDLPGCAPDSLTVTVFSGTTTQVDLTAPPYLVSTDPDELDRWTYGTVVIDTVTVHSDRDNIHMTVRAEPVDVPPVTPWNLFGEPIYVDIPAMSDLAGMTVLEDEILVVDRGNDPPLIAVFSPDGNLTRTFPHPDVPGTFDQLTTDGIWIWGVTDLDSLVGFDADGAVQLTVPLPDGVHGPQLAWDGALPGFWVSDGHDAVHAVNLDSALQQTIPLPSPDWDGLAVDHGDPDGGTLHLLTVSGSSPTVRRINPVTEEEILPAISLEPGSQWVYGGVDVVTGLFPEDGRDMLALSVFVRDPTGWSLRRYTLRWTLPWMTVTPGWVGDLSIGEPRELSVRSDPAGMEAGIYHGRLVLAFPQGGADTALDVTLDVRTVSVGDSEGSAAAADPIGWTVSRPSPNPCNTATSLTVTLPAAGTVRLTVHDVLGREVDRRSWWQAAGTRRVHWQPPAHAASGVYLLRLAREGQASHVRKVVVVK